jgi:hypothetical protein
MEYGLGRLPSREGRRLALPASAKYSGFQHILKNIVDFADIEMNAHIWTGAKVVE